MRARLIHLFIPLILFTSDEAFASTPDSLASPAAAQVEFFSPTGYAKQVRQVVVRFTSAMVALGDPRLADPFDIICSANGKGRWADTRNWVYDFDSDLNAGVSCRFSLKPQLRTLGGAPLTGQSVFTFDTGGPAIRASLPYDGWREIDEDQDFVLRLDAAATEASIEANAYCAIDGVVERIPLQILAGKEREDVLAERRALGYDYMTLLWKSGGRSSIRARNRSMEQLDASLVIVRCRRHLPPATEVLLHWGAGISTPSGIATHTDQQLAFRVRAAFTAQVECTRTNPRAGCTPVQPIEVNFTAQVPRALALGVRLRAAHGTLLSPRVKDNEAKAPAVDGVYFAAPFPESSTLTVVLPRGLVDDSGRTLTNAARFPLAVRVDAYPPLVKFSGEFGILEAKEGGILPVTLRNVEARLPTRQASMPASLLRIDADPRRIDSWLNRVEEASRPSGDWRPATPEDVASGKTLKRKIGDVDEDAAIGEPPRAVWHDTTGSHSVFAGDDSTSSFAVTKPAGSKPEEVIGIPLKQPGFYVVEIASKTLGSALLGPSESRYVATAALVTDMSVHLKWGREGSLVWVTRLSDGQPISAADVSVTDVCTGQLLWQGQTDTNGVALVGDSLGAPPQFGYFANCRPQTVLMALAKKGDDFSFTESTWARGITPTDFGLPLGNAREAAIFHTILDRSLFRAGETVSMKHFLRRHVSGGIAIPDRSAGMHEIEVLHDGSGQRYELNAEFDTDGVAVNDWKIPAEAKLGDYSVRIDGHPSAEFKVAEFRLPTMHGSVNGPARPMVAPQQVDIDIHVAYLSGGGAGGIPVKIRTLVEPQPIHFADYADYEFGGEPVSEGVSSSGGTPYDLDFEPEADSERETVRTRTIPLTLDDGGSARVTIDHLPKLQGPSRLTAELEYADANGETLTTTGYVRLVPASVAVGIRGDSWISPGKLRYRVVALDLNGRPVPKQLINVSLYQSRLYSYRKRLIGGFYAYETTSEIKRLQPSCSGLTNEQGLLLCELTPGLSGQVMVRAETRDERGTVVGATSSTWVVGKDNWWFGGTSGDRMDVLPEKKEYDARETARFQVRMPFQKATALVTVEREGVLKSFVTRLAGNAPIIEVPIEPNYSPNIFVSVLALRGRVASAEPGIKQSSTEELTALVDLTKPAYRLGIAEVKVGWRPHRLEVEVQPERAIYKVRDTANVKIHVHAAEGQALPPGGEVAVAAVDEALLDLARNDSWNLLASMMGTRGLEVWTSTAQMQVIGKRHYGRKAIPPGGGGGRELDRARELFDSLLFWQSRIPLDADGNASVSIPLNDSLSSFRIVAVTHAGAQLYGTGSANINTAQDLILLSGLPPLVREGDHYAAIFTVRNTSDRALTAQIEATSPQIRQLAALKADVPPGGSRDVRWSVTAPVGSSRIDWDVTARETAGTARDHLMVSERLIPAFPVRTYQATISQLTAPLSIPVERPRGSIEGRGGLEVTLQAKLADSLDGVREYMQLYPYICFEQLASRAVALQSREDWDALMARLPAYMDDDGLIRYFPSDRLRGDDTLTAYILAVANEAGWPINDADRERMIQALTRFVQGKLHRDSALPTADLSIRKLQAIEALSRYSAANAEMLDSVTVEPNLLPTSALLDWVGILKRVSGIAQRAQKRQQVLGLLRARLNFQGTTMGFSTEREDALWWLMISADSNANRLLLVVLDQPDWREDIPRLVRGALGRQQFGHWNTTVANAWGVLAMDKFSAAFESTPVEGSTTVRYGAEHHDVIWPQAVNASLVSVPWQSGQKVLQVTHNGSGAPWSMIRATAALPLDQSLFTGYKLTRTVTPVEQHRPGTWTSGDVARVHIDIEAQSDMSWVVVDDPIPAGATVLGSGLGGQSELLQRDNQSAGWAWLAFEEHRFEGYRGYYRFVPKGRWSVEYTVRLNDPGTFLLPATRVEAMYAPEMFGEVPNTAVMVQSSSAP